tara:strand:+ start:418 stop:684 length:267 start_codon:yes stop_codon:yes gene_type:complete
MQNKKNNYHHNDERGLIYESYKIDNISDSDCRSIFLDWLLGLDEKLDPILEIKNLYQMYSDEFKNHPMTLILREGIQAKKIKSKRKRN